LKAIARSLLLFASLLAFAGVADAKKPVNEVPPVKKDQAQIVFLRHSTVNARLSTLLYDTTSGTPRVVGLMGNHRKLVVDVPPGDYVFMIGSMPYCDFMKATVLANKRYNVVVIPKWMNSYSMRPVRHEGGQFWYGSEDYADIQKFTTLAGKAPESFVKEELKKAEEDYAAKWAQWQNKLPEQKALLTLNADDSET
jgi:hypothetical protein